MEDLIGIARIIGEENEQKLKDGITDLLLRQIERDLESRYEYDFIFDFDSIYKEAIREVESDLKEKIIKIYTTKIEEKFAEWIKDK